MTVLLKQAQVNEYGITLQAEKEAGYTVLLTQYLTWYYQLLDRKTYATKEKAMARFNYLVRKYGK